MNEKIAFVVSRFNEEITSKMSQVAQKRIKKQKAKLIKVVEVPGAFEIPLATKKIIEDKKIQAVVTLGAIIKGDTDHDQVIAHSIAKSLIDLSLRYRKPISLGVLGPNITWGQVERRIKEYSERAVDTAVEMLRKE